MKDQASLELCVSLCLQESDTVKRARWDEYFHSTKFVTGGETAMGHKFGRFVATDGVGVSVKMTRIKVLSFESMNK